MRVFGPLTALCFLAFQNTNLYTRVCSALLSTLGSSPGLQKSALPSIEILDHIAHLAIILDSQRDRAAGSYFFQIPFSLKSAFLGQPIITVHLGWYLLIILAKSKTYKILFEQSSCWVERNSSEILKPTGPAISSIFHFQPLVIKQKIQSPNLIKQGQKAGLLLLSNSSLLRIEVVGDKYSIQFFSSNPTFQCLIRLHHGLFQRKAFSSSSVDAIPTCIKVFMEKHTGTSEKSHYIRNRHDVSRWVTGYLSRTGTGEGGEKRQRTGHQTLMKRVPVQTCGTASLLPCPSQWLFIDATRKRSRVRGNPGDIPRADQQHFLCAQHTCSVN